MHSAHTNVNTTENHDASKKKFQTKSQLYLKPADNTITMKAGEGSIKYVSCRNILPIDISQMLKWTNICLSSNNLILQLKYRAT